MKTKNFNPATVNSGNMKEYYLDLLTARMNCSSQDDLLEKSQEWGRIGKDAKDDLARIENLYFAIGIFLDKAIKDNQQ